jgi:hypothetical protein
MMDLIQRKVEHPPLTEEALVTMIMARYAQYGVVPLTMPPPSLRQPSLTYKPFQDGTDLAYVRQLAQRYAYVFCVIPGPVPGMNQAYWGPRIRPGIPQAALSVDLGPTTNVESINFQYNALSPVKVVAWLQDRDTNALRKLTASSSKLMTLSAEPALSKLRYVREVTLKTVVQDDDPWQSVEGLTYAEALALVQARIDTSMRHVVVAQGELDTLRYGHVLEARKLVGLRGAGSSYDGTYYVQSVTHALRLGAYKQSFTLTREGVGTATPLVRP